MLASCGGGDDRDAQPPPPPPPSIAAAVASPLAARSDKVAELLQRGDDCGAAAEAAALRSDLTRAINDRSIPPLYLEDLSALVNEIQAQIPPCPQPNEDDGHDGNDDKQKKGKGDGKHKHHEGDD